MTQLNITQMIDFFVSGLFFWGVTIFILQTPLNISSWSLFLGPLQEIADPHGDL